MRVLGEEVAASDRLHGGDLSEVRRLTLDSGRSVIAKTAGEAEAEMLRALRDAGAPAPEVLGVEGDLLILEDLGQDEGPASAWSDLGAVLARLHSTRADIKGWHRDHAFGPVAILNSSCPTWPAFWAERRLLPQVAHLPPELARRLEALCGTLAERLPDRPPVLLHGDLWTGNVMARSGHVTGLIDPACYHGDPEVDLAMLDLFGRPSVKFWSAYGTPEGYAGRRPIYQLWPAMVHYRLFGPGYLGLVDSLLDETG
ncbi:fructosamine kinase family protein [Histidinibacterium aquaticum]|uniref:fructosamine kinase family protein n=1 Tax=Histidinibacterium aquaticum TaxID=2613962 RepID=UPI001CC33890|nr:fructosamine kinase family protein [Histidinibacterium aquaticum]